MKRTYAAARLLELGPLTFRDFHDITGWSERAAESALRELLFSGTVHFRYVRGRRVYERQRERRA